MFLRLNLLLVLWSLFGLVQLALAETSAKTTNYRVGLILPLSGPGALWGQHLKAGAELAQGQFPYSKIQFFLEDDQLDPAKAVSAYRKLRAANDINAVMLFGAQAGHAVIPIAEKEKVLSLLITTDPKPVLNTKYTARLALDAGAQAAGLLSQIKSEGIKKVALAGTTQEAMLEYLAEFEKIAESNNIEIVFKQDFPRGETDFRSTVEKILHQEAEAVVLSLLPNSLSSFAKQYKQRSPAGRIFGFAQAENLEEIKAAQGALEGLIFSALALNKDFVNLYSKRYNEKPQSFAGYSYDLVLMLEQAFSAGVLGNEQLATAMRGLKNFNGACGTYSSNSSFGFNLTTQLMTVRDGAIVTHN